MEMTVGMVALLASAGILLGFLVGFGLGMAFSGARGKVRTLEIQAEWERRVSETHAEWERQASEMRTELERQVNEAQTEVKVARETIRTLERSQKQLLEQQQTHFEREKAILLDCQADETAALQEQFERARLDMERQWRGRLKLLRAEFENLSQRHLRAQQEGLEAGNRENIGEILRPLREKIETFTTEFTRNRGQQIVLQTAVEAAVKGLIEQTKLVSENAGSLARALKADPKKQGNWGEAVLKNILDASGLTEGRDYFVQAQERDSHGKMWIPDVKVLLPGEVQVTEISSIEDGYEKEGEINDGERRESAFIVIDSKVSISAYLRYMQTEDEKEKKTFLREHIESVRKHYRELSAKNYAQNVANTAGYVLMFIPNEGSYLLAMENEPGLTLEAYRSHILIVNPTNLMLALNIVRILWQSRRQTENVKDIIESATRIYEKFASITENLVRLGSSIQNVVKFHDQLVSQFSQGKGNLVRQFTMWKELGITSTRQIEPKLLGRENEEESGISQK